MVKLGRIECARVPGTSRPHSTQPLLASDQSENGIPDAPAGFALAQTRKRILW
jgi:hypothetical protein